MRTKNSNLIQRFEVFTAVEIQVEVFWVVTPCSVVVGYQSFRVKMEAAWNCETLLSYYNKRYCVTTQKT
jgi:hypothetical protein